MKCKRCLKWKTAANHLSPSMTRTSIHRAEGDFRSLRRAILKPMTTVEQTNQTAAESPTRWKIIIIMYSMEPISMPLRDKCTPGCEHLHKGDSLGCESAIHCVCRCTRLRICPNHPTTPLPPTPQKVAERGPWDDAVSFNAKPLKACRQTRIWRVELRHVCGADFDVEVAHGGTPKFAGVTSALTEERLVVVGSP